MNQELKKLISLQEVDDQIFEIESLAGDLPNKVKKKEDKINKLQVELDLVSNRLDELEKNNRTLSSNLGDGQTKLNKYKDQLFLVKTNKEYDALNSEIDHIKTLISESEEKILMNQSDIEKGNESKDTHSTEIENLNTTLDSDKNNLKGALEDSQDELQGLNKIRDEIINAIDNKLLSEYNQLKKGRGTGISQLEDNCCGGCFSTLPPQVVIEIKSNTQLYTCPSCSVFMYWDEKVLDE